MTRPAPDLDVVVLGGGGHVGLPLSLAFAKIRPPRRHLRHQPGDPRPDRRRSDAVPRDRRRCAPAGTPADRAARVRCDRRDDRPDDAPGRRHRHAGGRVPRPVHDDLREGGRPDRAAPARRRARRPAQHGLPGHDRLRRAASRRAWLCGRRRLLPGADRRGTRPGGAPFAAADRGRGHGRRGRSSRPSCSAPSPRRRSARRPRKPSWRSSSPTPGAT